MRLISIVFVPLSLMRNELGKINEALKAKEKAEQDGSIRVNRLQEIYVLSNPEQFINFSFESHHINIRRLSS